MTRFKHALIVAFAPLPSLWSILKMFAITFRLALSNLFGGKKGANNLWLLATMHKEMRAFSKLSPEQQQAAITGEEQKLRERVSETFAKGAN